jgi:hypothetical protein
MGSVHLGRLLRGTRNAAAVRMAGGLLAAAGLAPLPAAAQQQASATMRTEIVDILTLRNGGDMDFGDILPHGAGTVVIPASATPTCTTTGALVRSGLCRSPVFTGTSVYMGNLRVMRPSGNHITLTGPGGATMAVDAFTFNSNAPTVFLGTTGANSRFRVEATDGTFTFYVGGTLHVATNQAPGIYNGSFTIRMIYD